LAWSSFNAHPAGSRLTTEDIVVVHWVRPILEAADHLLVGADALRSQRSEHLNVSASMTVVEYLLPPWLGEVRRAPP
jgi:DNA-binding transcriptional LysR family regulator